MIRTGLDVATSIGLQLNMTGRDPDMVGLGSYLVNVSGDCNGCHSVPQTAFAPGGNPYFLPGANPPFFSGRKQVNPATYLGGNQDFGVFPSPGGTVHIVSRNLTPDKTGLPEEGRTFSEFRNIMRTGVDHLHPSLPPPFTARFFKFGGEK